MSDLESIPFATGNTLVLALEGWNDAGEAASSAVEAVQDAAAATVDLVRIDDEEFFDYSVLRPRVRTGADGERELDWPGVTLSGPAEGGRVYVVRGPEPSFRWRGFVSRLVDLCREYAIVDVVLVGALLADAPHTRDIRVSRTSEDAEVRAEFGVERASYEGPTGVIGAFAVLAAEAGLRTLSLWAGVPHYTSSPDAPSPKATLALVEELARVLRLEIPVDALVVAAQGWETRVDEAVAQDEELVAYVRYLEEARDVVDSEEATGDAIAAEFERFLRDPDHGPGPA